MSADTHESLDRRQHDHDMRSINDSLSEIRRDVHVIRHGDGNGTPGMARLADEVFGPSNQSRLGLVARMRLAEERIEALAAQRRETLWLQRGIGLGVGLVALDTVVGVDLVGLFGRWFGGG